MSLGKRKDQNNPRELKPTAVLHYEKQHLDQNHISDMEEERNCRTQGAAHTQVLTGLLPVEEATTLVISRGATWKLPCGTYRF